MQNNGISGTVPTELGLLSSLQSLDLYNNTLQGTLPTELGLITDLVILFAPDKVSDRSFTNGAGPVDCPSVFSSISQRLHWNYTYMAERHVRSSPFYSELQHFNSDIAHGSAEVGLLTDLQIIDLNDNSLTGTWPTELGKVLLSSQWKDFRATRLLFQAAGPVHRKINVA